MGGHIQGSLKRRSVTGAAAATKIYYLGCGSDRGHGAGQSLVISQSLGTREVKPDSLIVHGPFFARRGEDNEPRVKCQGHSRVMGPRRVHFWVFLEIGDLICWGLSRGLLLTADISASDSS